MTLLMCVNLKGIVHTEIKNVIILISLAHPHVVLITFYFNGKQKLGHTVEDLLLTFHGKRKKKNRARMP